MSLNKKNLALVGITCVVFIWSGWITISRLGVQSVLTPLDISMLRFATALCFTIPFWISYDWKRINVARSVFVALNTGCIYTMLSFYGLQTAKAAKAGVLVNGLMPVFGAILTVLWLKLSLKPQHYVGIAIILLANGLMFFSEGLHLSAAQLNGLIFLVLASLVYSSYTIGVKAWGFQFRDIVVIVPIVNTLVLLPFWLLLPSNIPKAGWNEIILQSAYQGVLVTIGAGILITNAIQVVGPMVVSMFIAFVPATTALVAFIFLREELGVAEIASIVLCTLGIFVYTKV